MEDKTQIQVAKMKCVRYVKGCSKIERIRNKGMRTEVQIFSMKQEQNKIE